MSSMTSDRMERTYPATHDGWEERRTSMTTPSLPATPSAGLLIGGLVVLGLGAFALYYLGPDLARYLKIKRM